MFISELFPSIKIGIWNKPISISLTFLLGFFLIYILVDFHFLIFDLEVKATEITKYIQLFSRVKFCQAEERITKFWENISPENPSISCLKPLS